MFRVSKDDKQEHERQKYTIMTESLQMYQEHSGISREELEELRKAIDDELKPVTPAPAE